MVKTGDLNVQFTDCAREARWMESSNIRHVIFTFIVVSKFNLIPSFLIRESMSGVF
jgi:hypothetical protein